MPDEYGSYMDAGGYGDTELDWRGCCVKFPDRLPGQTPSEAVRIHANSAHISVGVKTAHFDPTGRLVVTTDSSVTPIMAGLCSSDETLSARGISQGPSIGSTTSIYVFYSGEESRRLYLDNAADYDIVAGALANFWLMWATVRHRGTPGGKSPRERLDLLEARVTELEGSP